MLAFPEYRHMNVAIIHPCHKKSSNRIQPERSFCYGEERISFERFDRKTGVPRILIKVHPNCRVSVFAPPDATDEAVLAAVKKRGHWINAQLNKFHQQSMNDAPRRYVSGETHYYLGKQYLLKVLEAPASKQSVKLLRGKLEVSVRQKNSEKVCALLNDWYKTRAKDVFVERLDVLLEQTLWVDQRPPLRLQTMQTQWGSCSVNGRITLNPHLVKAPRICIDYVILHELCHLAEHNHSELFYRLLKQVMPDWESVKTRLDGIAGLLLSGV